MNQAVGGEVVAQAFEADVGDAVAVGIGAPDLGRIGEVQTQTVRRAQAGAFAEQHDHHLRLQPLAHLVTKRDAALPHQADRRKAPAIFLDLLLDAL